MLCRGVGGRRKGFLDGRAGRDGLGERRLRGLFLGPGGPFRTRVRQFVFGVELTLGVLGRHLALFKRRFAEFALAVFGGSALVLAVWARVRGPCFAICALLRIVAAPLGGGARRRKGLQDRAELLFDLIGRERDRRRRRLEKAGDRGRLADGAQHLHAGGVRHHDLADGAVVVGEQRDGAVLALGGGAASDLGPADADVGDRRLDRHGIHAGLGDLAADEGEDALDDGKNRLAGLGVGVVNELVHDHAAALAQGKRRVVGEHDPDRAVGLGLDHVALEHRCPVLGPHLRAVAPGQDHVAGDDPHLADGERIEARAGLRELARRDRPGQLRREIGGDARAAFGCQRGRFRGREIAANENGLAVRSDENQVGPLAHEVRHQQHVPARHHHGLSGALENDVELAVRP